jgi:mxaC protein
MNFAVDTPWLLAGLLLTLLPLFDDGVRHSPYPWLELLPADAVSAGFTVMLRAAGMAAIAALVLGLAGLHRTEQSIERIGQGANIVLLLDRSNSMDNTFAGKAPDSAEASKAAAARRLLTEFVAGRPHDMIGIAEYSTSPLFVLPLTENKQAIQAAIDATAAPALAYTNIGKGLAMAMSFFDGKELTGSRIVLLVSDGAAAIDPDSESMLQQWFKRQQVRLYWIFLRTANSPGIYEQPADSRNDNAEAMPERYLHLFFSSLNIPYQAYEAESPDAMQKAIADINRLEHFPRHYRERIPKQDLSALCYRWAAGLMLALLALKLCEVRR